MSCLRLREPMGKRGLQLSEVDSGRVSLLLNYPTPSPLGNSKILQKNELRKSGRAKSCRQRAYTQNPGGVRLRLSKSSKNKFERRNVRRPSCFRDTYALSQLQ